MISELLQILKSLNKYFWINVLDKGNVYNACKPEKHTTVSLHLQYEVGMSSNRAWQKIQGTLCCGYCTSRTSYTSRIVLGLAFMRLNTIRKGLDTQPGQTPHQGFDQGENQNPTSLYSHTVPRHICGQLQQPKLPAPFGVSPPPTDQHILKVASGCWNS